MSKVIYLTIDDAPSSFMKDKVDYLLKRQIPALFYCRGEFLEEHLDQAVYAILNGFLLGNHSYSHPHFSTLTLDQAREEVVKTEQLLNMAYEKAKVIRPYKLFRFPFLDKGSQKSLEFAKALQELLKSMGFIKATFPRVNYQYYASLGKGIDAPWTYDAREYALFNESFMQKHQLYTVEDFLKRMERNLPEEGYGLSTKDSADIVLLHDFETTHHLFEPIVNKLSEMGVAFATPQFTP